jgi:hypothetical protein
MGTLRTTISQNIAQKLDIVTDATRNGASNSSRALRIPAESTWTLARSRSPLIGPATARVASARSARRSYRKAFRRAAKHQEWKGGRVIR